MKRCPKCGSSIGTNTRFCWNCGAKLSGGKFLKKSKRKTHRKIWNIIAIMVAMMLVGSCLVHLYLQGNSKKPKVASADETITFLKKMGQYYGLENALSDLTVDTITNIGDDAYYRLQQNYKGIPVYGQSIVAMTGDNEELKSIVGNVADVPNEISLTPNVTQEQINACIFEWLTMNLINEEYENIETSDIEIDTVDECSLCIYHGESGWTLAYTVEAYGYVFVIDAHSAEALTVNTMFLPAIGYLASDTERTNGFEVSLEDDGRYGLVNEEYKILIYDLKGQNSDKKLPDVNDFVKSNDNIFGNAPEEQGFEDGAKELISLGKIAELFSAKYGFSTETGVILGYYNDGKSLGSNAFGGTGSDGIGYIFIGQNHATDDLDVLAHEFCHIVTSTKAHLDTSKKETRSVSEALSDIFGVLVEAKLSNWDEPDWVVETTAKGYFSGVHRSLSNPEEDGNFSKFSNMLLGTVYQDSTILSHSAYLMWNGIDDKSEWKIPADKLMDLWYRAILMMPSDCDFTTCRKMVEWAALSVDGLTDAQRNCIAEAFDTVGIYKPEVSPEILISCDYNAKPNSVLNVFNTSGELHPRYTLSISGTIAEHELAYSTDILTDIGYRYEKTVEVKKATSYKLNLPDGYYTLTVSDRHNPQHTYSFTVSISDKGTEDIIGLYTDFEDQLIVQITEETRQSEKPVIAEKQLTQINAYIGNDNCWQVNLNYNNDGLLAGYTQDSYSSDHEIHYSYVFTYSEKGQLTQSQEILSGNDCSKFYYNDEGRLIGWSYREFSTSDEEVYSCEYNASGQRVRDISMDGNNENRYIFDNQGRVISQISRFRYGDMSGSSEIAMSYGDNGMLYEKKTISDWGIGTPSEERFVYTYDYKPFTTEYYINSNGEKMYSNLNYEDAAAGEIVSLMIDETASFEMENGYLVKVMGADYTYDFFYNGASDESFASRIPVPPYEDELTGGYLAEYEDIKIIISATNNSDYYLTYITSEVTIENIPLAYFNSNTDTDKRLMFDVDACYPEYNGYIEVRWSKDDLFPYTYYAMIDGLTDTEGDYSSLKKVGVFVPAN